MPRDRLARPQRRRDGLIAVAAGTIFARAIHARRLLVLLLVQQRTRGVAQYYMHCIAVAIFAAGGGAGRGHERNALKGRCRIAREELQRGRAPRLLQLGGDSWDAGSYAGAGRGGSEGEGEDKEENDGEGRSGAHWLCHGTSSMALAHAVLNSIV